MLNTLCLDLTGFEGNQIRFLQLFPSCWFCPIFQNVLQDEASLVDLTRFGRDDRFLGRLSGDCAKVHFSLFFFGGEGSSGWWPVDASGRLTTKCQTKSMRFSRRQLMFCFTQARQSGPPTKRICMRGDYVLAMLRSGETTYHTV